MRPIYTHRGFIVLYATILFAYITDAQPAVCVFTTRQPCRLVSANDNHYSGRTRCDPKYFTWARRGFSADYRNFERHPIQLAPSVNGLTCTTLVINKGVPHCSWPSLPPLTRFVSRNVSILCKVLQSYLSETLWSQMCRVNTFKTPLGPSHVDIISTRTVVSGHY